MLYNPFYDIVKADELPPELATQLFIREASPIWHDIQYPVNHLIVGSRGAGKTIALRQLDHKSTVTYPHVPYVGIYLQLSRISTLFRDLFAPHQGPHHFSRAFADYLWLEIVKELARYLRSSKNHHELAADAKRHLLARLADGIVAADSTEALDDQCSRLQKEIEDSIHRWLLDGQCTWTPRVDLPASLGRTVTVLRKLIPHLHQNYPALYLLLDESSPIPADCQQVINGLLQRGRSYCVKLAIRPYEWSTLETEANRKIELDTDVKLLHIQYPDELETKYAASMRAVANRILETRVTESEVSRPGWPTRGSLDIEAILADDADGYAGFRSVCAASSGNPQNLLSICSCIFSTARETTTTAQQSTNTSDVIHIPARIQHEAIVRWSKDYEEQNPHPDSRAFCRSLLRLVRESDARNMSIGFRYSHEQSDLFATDYIPDDIGKLIKAAFSAGFLRNSDTGRTSLFEVSSDFHLNRGLLPRDGLSLELPTAPPRAIDRDFVRQNARERARSQPKHDPDAGRSFTVFLSTSFATRLRQQRNDIKRVLGKEQIQCEDVEDVCGDQFLFTAIRRAVNNHDITILDATVLRPYTMLEIGLCAGASKSKSVICVVNDNTGDVLSGLPAYIKKLPIVSFSLDADSLAHFAVQVRSRGAELLSKRSEFEIVAITDVPLRSRRRPRSVFLSLPPSALRDRAIEDIRTRLGHLNWTVIVEEDMESYGTNEFQVSIQCAYASRVGIIDTTGEGGPNLLQCYKLGLFAGKRRPWRVLQVEENGRALPDTFASVPGVNHVTWTTIEDLARHVETFVKEVQD